MSMWTGVFLVVLIGCALSAWESWLKHRNRVARRQADQGDGELEALRARVEALEAIVTNPEFDLAQRIDALADEPRRRAG